MIALNITCHRPTDTQRGVSMLFCFRYDIGYIWIKHLTVIIPRTMLQPRDKHLVVYNMMPLRIYTCKHRRMACISKRGVYRDDIFGFCSFLYDRSQIGKSLHERDIITYHGINGNTIYSLLFHFFSKSKTKRYFYTFCFILRHNIMFILF